MIDEFALIKTEVFKQISLPIFIDESLDLVKELKKRFEGVKNMFEHFIAKNGNQTVFFRRIKEAVDLSFLNSKKIIKCIEKYNSGLIKEAYIVFEDYINALKNKNNLFTHDLYYGNDYYRIRVSEKKLTKRKEMFHVPNNKRYLIKNQRYSSSGHPCLYLASSLELAGIEMGFPMEFYYSVFKNTDKNNFKLLMLFYPQDASAPNFGMPKNVFLSFIAQLPLIMSCSIVRRNDADFKEEYIIPHFLMQWVVENREHTNIIGVSYSSASCNMNSMEISAYNIAIPIFDCKSAYCGRLKKIFKLSKPQKVNILDYIKKIDIDFLDKLFQRYCDARYGHSMELQELFNRIKYLYYLPNDIKDQLVFAILKSIYYDIDRFIKEVSPNENDTDELKELKTKDKEDLKRIENILEEATLFHIKNHGEETFEYDYI